MACGRELVMNFSNDRLLRRIDFDLMRGEMIPRAMSSSVHHSFSGVTVPSLQRTVKRNTAAASPIGGHWFNATFDHVTPRQ